MATGQEADMKIPVQAEITSRDGTLTKDSAMWNCFVEPEPDGSFSTQKRPGLKFLRQFPAGTAGGIFAVNDTQYIIQENVIFALIAGTPFPITGASPGSRYQILSDVPVGQAVLKSHTGLWTFNGVTVTQVTDPNYPALTTFGIAYLDGTYYVQDGNGIVYGSDLEDATSWNPLNFVAGDPSLGLGIGIQRHLNYVLSFYQRGLQVFYDGNNNPPASPLLPVGNAEFQTGTPVGESIVEMSDQTFFIGRSAQVGRTIEMMAGLTLTQISTPYVEKILRRSNLLNVSSMGLKTAGHTFYLLALGDLGLTLAYDVILGKWQVWTSVVNGVEQTWNGLHYYGSETQDLVQDLTGSGQVYTIDMDTFQDNLQPINVRVRTANLDWGNLKRKRFAAHYLVADTQDTTVQVRYTDDDYRTYSVFRSADLSTVKKQIRNCGSSRRRAYEFLHTDNTGLTLYFYDSDMSVGPS